MIANMSALPESVGVSTDRPTATPASESCAAMPREALKHWHYMLGLTVLVVVALRLSNRLIAGNPAVVPLAHTAAFTVLVLTQLFNCFNARSESASAFRAAFSNRWLWAAVALSTALQAAVVHLPLLNLAFGTVPLSAGQWCVCVAMASGVLWFSEGRKLLRRHWNRRSLAPRVGALEHRPRDA
jgi:magnesium-transporting ATPase (P-type)